MESKDKKLTMHTVYYDGSCPMCTAIMGRVRDSSHGNEFSLKDITTDDLPQMISTEAANKEIYVIGDDGRVYKNADAILQILSYYSAWKPFVWIGRLPGIKQLLPLGYNFVAAHRHTLFNPKNRGYWRKVFLVVVFFIFGALTALVVW